MERLYLSAFQSHTITGLRPFTQYLVSLQVENPAGRGPSTTVVVTTEEGGEFCLLSTLSTTGSPVGRY